MKRDSLKAFCLVGLGISAVVFLLSCSPSGVKEPREKAQKAKIGAPSGKKVSQTPGPGSRTGPVEQSAEPAGPRLVSLQFDPPRPVTGDTVRAVVVVEGVNSTEETVQVRWNINGKDVEETGIVLERPVHYGDSLTATAELLGPDGRRQMLSTTVLVENASPVIGISQATVDAGEYVAAIQAEDPEKDEVVLQLVEAPEGMVLDEGAGVLRWRPSAGHKGGVFPVVLEGKDSLGNVCRLSFDVTVSGADEEQPSAQGG